MTPYQEWQKEHYGNILPEYDNPFMPVDNDEQYNADRIDEERKLLQEEDLWHNEQIF